MLQLIGYSSAELSSTDQSEAATAAAATTGRAKKLVVPHPLPPCAPQPR
jgi:hypothetical protein